MSIIHQAALSLAAGLAFIGGCAKLTVDVRILDKGFWSSPDAMLVALQDDAASIARSRGDGSFDRARAEIIMAAHTALDSMSGASFDPKNLVNFKNSLSDYVNQEFAKADVLFADALIITTESQLGKPLEQRLASLGLANSKIREGRGIIDAVPKQIATDLRAQADQLFNAMRDPSAAAPRATAEKSIATAEKQAEAAVLTLSHAGMGILSDPQASMVVTAPAVYWRGKYNESFGTGNIGNTDIAIKMEGPGSFTVKGVRLDAAKITNATFALARQTIGAAAAFAGVPLPSAGKPVPTGLKPTETPLPDVSTGIVSPIKEKALADASLAKLRFARLTLLETIVSQRSALDSASADVRKAAIQNIKSVYASYKSELVPPPPTPASP